MALNSSGPLSFGGSTVGQSINLELGVSATALASINSTAFRTLAGVASGQISLANFYGKSNISGWLAIYATTIPAASNSLANAVTADSSNNIYVMGMVANSSRLIKISSAGTLLASTNPTNLGSWTYALGESNYRIVTDSSNNVYTVSVNSSYTIVTKFNSSLTVQDCKRYQANPVPSGSNNPSGLFVSSGGDIYYGNSGYNGAYEVLSGYITKLDSSFNFVSALSNNRGDTGGSTSDIVLDSSGNLISLFRNNTIYKFSGAGPTVTWRNKPVDTAGGNYPQNAKLAIDSSDNLYMGYMGTTAAVYCGICKVNSSGVVQWAREVLKDTGGYINQVIVGSDGFIYAVGNIPLGDYNYWGGYIVKYNSSGTIQWQRILYNANIGSNDYQVALTGIRYTSEGLAIAGGIKNNGNSTVNFIVGLIPADGAGTGSYTISGVNVTYAASTNTESARTLNDTDPAIPINAGGNLTSALTPDISSPSNTITKVSLS